MERTRTQSQQIGPATVADHVSFVQLLAQRLGLGIAECHVAAAPMIFARRARDGADHNVNSDDWPRRGSNPHVPIGTQDFKSCASADSATRPA